MRLQDIHSSPRPPERFGLPAEREAEAALLAIAAERRQSPKVPTETAPFSLPVRVNHGRWIVECLCGGAQLASRTDHRFFCIDCGNVAFEGKWVHTEWPEEAEEIEVELGRRTFARNQNWTPGETLEELREEAKAPAMPKWVKPKKRG